MGLLMKEKTQIVKRHVIKLIKKIVTLTNLNYPL